MADDLTVRFAGDASQLNASIASARQALASFAPQSTGAASSSLGILTAALGGAKRATDSLGSSFVNLTAAILAADAIKSTASAYASYAEACFRAEYATATFIRNLEVAPIVAEYKAIKDLDSGLLGYVTSAAYAQRGTEMFTVANSGMAAVIGRSVIAVEESFTKWPGFIQRGIDAVNRFRVATFTRDAGDTLGLIAAAGRFDAFSAAVDSAANKARAKMAQIEADYQHTLRTLTLRDPSGREVEGPSEDDSSAPPDTDALTAKRNDALAEAAKGVRDNAQVLNDFIAQIQKIPGVSDEAAQHIEAMLASVPGYTLDANDAMIQYLQSFAKGADEAEAMTTRITGAFKDAQNGAQTLADVVLSIKNPVGQLEMAKGWGAALSASLDPSQAQRFYSLVQTGIQRQLESLRAVDTQERGLIDRIDGQHDANLKNIGDLEHQALSVEILFQHYKAITDQLSEQNKLQEALNQSTPSSRVNDLQEQNKTLQSGLSTRKSGDDADVSDAEKDLAIRTAVLEAANQTDQGVIAVLYSMKNRLNAAYGNYGDSLSGVIQKPRAYSAVDDAGGTFDASKLTNVNSYQYARVSALFDKVFGDDTTDDPTKGATHYYNPSLASPSWARGMNNQTQIGGHVFGNPDGPPVMSSDDASKAGEIIQKNNDDLRQQQAIIAGGTAAEKEQLAIAQQNAAGLHDEVAQAQALLDAKRKDLASAQGGSPDAVRTAQQAVADAQIALDQKVAAVQKADSDLAIARTKEGSQERLTAQLAAYDAEEARATGNAAKIADLEKQKLEATQAYNKQKSADAVEAENASFDATQRAFAQERDQINENARLGEISGQQKEAQLDASLARQLAATQAHYVKIRAIEQQYDAGSPQGDTKLAQQEAVAEDKINEDRVKSAQAANASIVESYKSSMESIGSTVASSLEGMLEHTQKFDDLIRNVAKNIASQFLSAGLKMAADWVVNQTKMVAVTVASEAQKTAAVASGNAAQQSSTVASTLATAASTASAFASSIAADAAKAFAGVVAFLAPILGPAAVGPAAGVEATVMAAAASVPHFDQGAWSLPSSGLAMVHAGETIIPAGPAQAFRDAMGGGGGGGGGATHNHTWNIDASGNRHPKAVVDEIKANARSIGQLFATMTGHDMLRSR